MPFFNIFSRKKENNSGRNSAIIADTREKNALVISELVKRGAKVEIKHLPIGDYIANGVIVERKTISDFKASIINKRIFSQMDNLRQFPKAIFLVEGILDEDIYSGGIHENSFRGAILSLTLKYRIPFIFTQNAEDSAKYLIVLSANKSKAEPSIRASRILPTKKEQIQFILEGFPHIGPAKANMLVKKFKTLKNIFNAPSSDLEQILGKYSDEFVSLLT